MTKRPGEDIDGRGKIYQNHQKISSKQIQMNVNYYHPSSCPNIIHLTNLSHYLAINGAGDREEHLTNTQTKGQKSIHKELFLYNHFCYLYY